MSAKVKDFLSFQQKIDSAKICLFFDEFKEDKYADRWFLTISVRLRSSENTFNSPLSKGCSSVWNKREKLFYKLRNQKIIFCTKWISCY